MIWHRAPGMTARVLLPRAWWSRPCLRIWSLVLPCRRCPSLHPGRFFPVALIFERWVITLKKRERIEKQDKQAPKSVHSCIQQQKQSNAGWWTTTRVYLYIDFTIINLQYFSEDCGLCWDRDNRKHFQGAVRSRGGRKIKSVKVHAEGFHKPSIDKVICTHLCALKVPYATAPHRVIQFKGYNLSNNCHIGFGMFR